MAEKYKVIISDRAKSMLGVHIRFMAKVDKKAAKEKKGSDYRCVVFPGKNAAAFFILF